MEASTIEVLTLVFAIVSLVVACCTPLLTAVANVIIFGALRSVKLYLAPKAPPSAITHDDQLVCHFVPREGMV